MSQPQFFGCSHLQCSKTHETFPSETLHNLSPAGAPLLARYDLAQRALDWKKSDLKDRPETLWRYAEVLPLRSAEAVVSF